MPVLYDPFNTKGGMRIMVINLRKFYPWYTHDEYLEVRDEIAAELFADKRFQRTHERIKRRSRVYSLDAANGKEVNAIISFNDSPERVVAMMDRYCRLCRALNSLPELQAQRVEAHYLHGVSQRKIAKREGVSECAISVSIKCALTAMKKYYKNFEVQA
jgi:RNA polymerase sigma-70 factor (ECF subfamily)